MSRGERSVRREGYGGVGGWQSLVWYVVSYTHAYDALRHNVGDLVTMSQGKTLGTPEGFSSWNFLCVPWQVSAGWTRRGII